MKNPIALFGAFGVGVGLMYFFDPNRGKRRRALMRDQAVHLSNAAQKEWDRKKEDLRNKAQGVWFETEKIFEKEPLTDFQLQARIRSRLGRLTSHPHAVKTAVERGRVTLRGMILSDEVETVLQGISAIRGVTGIENNLEAHEDSHHISSLQGGKQNRKMVLEKQKEWSAKTRILIGASALSLLLRGIRKRDIFNSLAASLGVGLLARSALNKPLEDLKLNNGDRNIKVQKAITINASADKVFNVLKYPQYFPYFMSHVKKVEPLVKGQFLWTVDGVFGKPVQWETKVIGIVSNESIKWEHINGHLNGQTGFLRLEKVDKNTTRLHAEIKFPAIIGNFGNFAAGIFSQDPKSRLNDDFLRLKTYIEKGKLPHDAAINNKRRIEMKVREIMTENPAFATLNTSLHDVAYLMSEFNCGCLPVLENENDMKPIGVITDRDITNRTVAHQKDPLNMVAGEIMSDMVITVTPDMSVEECIGRMEKNQLRRMIVVDEKGKLCGIVAQADIARSAPSFETAELVKDVSL